PYEYNKGLSLLPTPKSDPHKRLVTLCNRSLKLYGFGQEYKDRLEEELRVIKNKDFSTYFLIVAEMVAHAKKNGARVGPGRGSAAGSLVCYLLGITEVDPIKYDLLFGRFINEERNDYPDIDVDFSDRDRKMIKDYLTKKFKNVASISTYGYFR